MQQRREAFLKITANVHSPNPFRPVHFVSRKAQIIDIPEPNIYFYCGKCLRRITVEKGTDRMSLANKRAYLLYRAYLIVCDHYGDQQHVLIQVSAQPLLIYDA